MGLKKCVPFASDLSHKIFIGPEPINLSFGGFNKSFKSPSVPLCFCGTRIKNVNEINHFVIVILLLLSPT